VRPLADVATGRGFANQVTSPAFLRVPVISIPVNGREQPMIETGSPPKASLEPFGLNADASKIAPVLI
jgi:hypothetical protein